MVLHARWPRLMPDTKKRASGEDLRCAGRPARAPLSQAPGRAPRALFLA